MGRPSYLIAKYVSDVFRNEPINIGVIVWADGATSARFLAAKEDGTVNGNLLPKAMIRSLATYKQWVEYWTRALAGDGLKRIGATEFRAKHEPEFLDVLLSTASTNYILERGGELLEEVPVSELRDVAEFLFQRLVQSPKDKPDSLTTDEVRDGLLIEANVASDPRVKRNEPIRIPVGGKSVRHEFHLYIGNGEPEWLAHIVPLTSQPRDVKNKADIAAYRFGKVIEAGKIDQSRCVALTYAPEEPAIDLLGESFVTDSLTELGAVAQVIDVGSSRAELVRRIREWVTSTKPHS